MIIKRIKITLNNTNDVFHCLEQVRDANDEPIALTFAEDAGVAHNQAVATFADDSRGSDGTFYDLVTELLEEDENVVRYTSFFE